MKGESAAYPNVLGGTGLTKRELLAAMSMQGMLANSFGDGQKIPLSEASAPTIARLAVYQADALIAELSKDQLTGVRP